jgi:3-ketosteroid 9alpha-monooxygenase subunit A
MDATLIQPSDLDVDLNMLRHHALDPDAQGWGMATYHGPSIMYYYTTSTGGAIEYRSWWVNFHTPISDDEVELTSGVIVASMDGSPLPQMFLDNYPIAAIAAFGQDVEVWKTKLYRADPILCDGDGPIHKLRKWYNRFYLPRSEERWDEPADVIHCVRD